MDSSSYSNPYSSTNFLTFFVQLFTRLWGYLSGTQPEIMLAADEIQMLVLVGVAASSALIGTFLVLRKMTMLANSLSHTLLLGIVIAFWISTKFVPDEHLIGDPHGSTINLQAMLLAALVMGFITTFLTETLTKYGRLQEDASTGLVFMSLFALGIILLTLLTRNAHIGTEVIMGNVDALQVSDCKMVYLVLGINIALFVLFFKEYQLTTFDAGLAKTLGFSALFFNYLMMAQVSLTSISAFRAVGVLMVLAFITGPPLAARLLTHYLKSMLCLAVLIGCVSALFGVALSRHLLTVHNLALSTGGIVVCVIAFVYATIASFYLYRR